MQNQDGTVNKTMVGTDREDIMNNFMPKNLKISVKWINS